MNYEEMKNIVLEQSAKDMMCGLAACACFFLPAVGAEAKEDVTMFRDGVYLEDVSLSGMTVEEVDEQYLFVYGHLWWCCRVVFAGFSFCFWL